MVAEDTWLWSPWGSVVTVEHSDLDIMKVRTNEGARDLEAC